MYMYMLMKVHVQTCHLLCTNMHMYNFGDAVVAPLSTEKDPEQTGPLVTPALLPTLSPQQLLALQMAKKYCQDVSAKHVSSTEYGSTDTITYAVF